MKPNTDHTPEVIQILLNKLRLADYEVALAKHLCMNSEYRAKALEISNDEKDQSLAVYRLLLAEKDKEIALLKAKLKVKVVKKDSANSSLPPSSDINKPNHKTISLRSSSEKKVGGQLGHSGYHHAFITASSTEILIPKICSCCNKDLTDMVSTAFETRQVLDIPVIQPFATDYVAYTVTCTCGVRNDGKFPEGVDGAFSFGPNLETWASYSYNRQCNSLVRIQEQFLFGFNVSMSTGTLWNMVQRHGDKATAAYNLIKENLEKSTDTKYIDETSIRVNGFKRWAWIVRTELYSYLFYSSTRAHIELETIFPNGFSNAVIVHDRYAGYFKFPCLANQMCTIHLLRDLKYLDQLYEYSWSKEFTKLIMDARLYWAMNTFEECLKIFGEMEARLEILLAEELPKEMEKLIVFQKQMEKHKNSLFTFLQYDNVRPDNNLAEQGLRGLKVKMNISQFRAVNGAVAFLKMRSISETTVFNKQNQWDVFSACTLIPKRISTRELVKEVQTKYTKTPSP